MGVSIDEIVAHVNKNPLAKPTRYEIAIYKKGAEDGDAREIFFNCSAVQIPGINLQFYQDRRYAIGLTYPVLENKKFTEIVMTFYESEYERERKYFSDWIASMIDTDTHRTQFYNDYVRNIDILQYNAQNELVYRIHLFSCSPTNISQLNRGYDLTDTIPEFNVNIQFQDLEEEFYARNK